MKRCHDSLFHAKHRISCARPTVGTYSMRTFGRCRTSVNKKSLSVCLTYKPILIGRGGAKRQVFEHAPLGACSKISCFVLKIFKTFLSVPGTKYLFNMEVVE